jgi:DNA-binding transcriptional regulator YdaS (Cro superfamily)
METHAPTLTLISNLGGQSASARLFGIKQPSISGWLKHGIPSARLQTLHAWARLPDAARLPEPTITPKRVRAALRAANMAEPRARRA